MKGKIRMKNYEEICKALAAAGNVEAFEQIDEALQMLSPADGKDAYRLARKYYNSFCGSLDVADLKNCAVVLARVTGYEIPVNA